MAKVKSVTRAEKQRKNSGKRGRPFEKGNSYAWKPGQSGNLKGRPPLSGSIAEQLRAILLEDNGDGMTKREVILRRVVDEAISGKQWAVEFISERTEGRVAQQVDLQESDKVVFHYYTPQAEIDEKKFVDPEDYKLPLIDPKKFKRDGSNGVDENASLNNEKSNEE